MNQLNRLGLLCLIALAACQQSDHPALPSALSPPPPLPQSPDGSIDYVTFLNQRCAAGVTRQNNAAVLLLAIVPPFKPGSEDAAKHLLGVAQNASAAVWVDYDTFAAAAHVPPTGIFWDDMDAASRRAWTDADYPLVAQWLAAQAPALDAIALAVQRPLYYVPMVSARTPPMLLDCFMSGGLASYRSIANTFAARATRRLAVGDVEGFIADLSACHRLADLMAQRPFLIDQLVAVAIHGIPTTTLAKLLERGELRGPTLQRTRRMLDETPALDVGPDCIDVAERAFTADLLQLCRRGQIRQARAAILPVPRAVADLPLGDVDQVDWTLVEKAANAQYDQAARLLVIADRALFRKTLNQMETARAVLQIPAEDFWLLPWTASLPGYEDKVAQANAYIRRRPGESRAAYSTRMAAYLFGDDITLGRVRTLVESQRLRRAAVRTALAAAAYRAATGQFPPTLAALVPTYLDAVPVDWFSGQPLVYRTDGADVIIYSIGNDEKDDGGKLVTSLNGGDIGARVKGFAVP